MPRGIFGKNPHYEFGDRDPVFDHMANVLKASGDTITQAAHRCHMSPSTFYNWFVSHSTTSPRHDSIQIFYRAYGLEYGSKSNLRVVVSTAKKVGKQKAA